MCVNKLKNVERELHSQLNGEMVGKSNTCSFLLAVPIPHLHKVHVIAPFKILFNTIPTYTNSTTSSPTFR